MISGFSDDLQIENLKPLLMAKAEEENGAIGWVYIAKDLTKEELASAPLLDSWKPVPINVLQAVILNEIMEKGDISTTSDFYLSLCKDPEFSVSTLSHLV